MGEKDILSEGQENSSALSSDLSVRFGYNKRVNFGGTQMPSKHRCFLAQKVTLADGFHVRTYGPTTSSSARNISVAWPLDSFFTEDKVTQSIFSQRQ
jgi:hypothetical protein